MQVKNCDIIPRLLRYIKGISAVENSGNSLCTFRVLPDTCVEIFISYRNQNIAKIDTKTDFYSSKSFVTSRMRSYMDVSVPPGSGSIAVCFHSGAAFPFFHLPMNELTDQNLLLNDLWGHRCNELENQMSRCKSYQKRALVIQNFLQTIIQYQPSSKNAYEYCLGQINLNKGQVSVRSLLKEINISQRQLSRQFNTCMGVSPKEYARVKRFLCTIEHIKKFPSSSLTTIAYDGGYFDQAHFIHDCKEFAGLTPKELIKSNIVSY